MKMNKIIGMPAIVTARNRVVIDKSFRKLFSIRENGKVLMQRDKTLLRIMPTDGSSSLEAKEISNGRFNLPTDWAVENKVNIGDYVYLLVTSDGILICPKNRNF